MKKPNFFGRFLLKSGGIPVSDERYWSTWMPQGSTVQIGGSDMQKVVGDGTGLDIIMAPVLWAARRLAESPVGIQIEDDSQIHFDHDVARLLHRPNPWYAGSTMRMAMAIEFFLDGNTYLRKIRDGMKKPIALVFIPSWCIMPMVPMNGAGYVDQYLYNPGGLQSGKKEREQIIDAADIVHLRDGIDPNYTRKGLSRLKILLRELFTDYQGSMMTAMLLKNAGLMGVIISPKQGVSITKPTETKKYIEEEFTAMRIGKPMVMTAPTDVNYFGADASKIDLSVLRNIPEERVCAMLNLPAAVVGFGTGMKQTKVGATLVELRAMAYEDCIIPTQNSWCDEIDLQLIPDFEQNPDAFHAEFDNSAVRVLQDDENRISDRLVKQLVSGGLKLSEFREAIGEEVDSTMDVYYIPASVVVTPAKEINTPTAPPPGSSPEGAQGATGGSAATGPNAEGSTSGETEPPKSWWTAYFKDGLHGRARLTPKLSKLAHRLAKEERAARKKWQGTLSGQFRTYGDAVAQRFVEIAHRREKSNGRGGVAVKAQIDWYPIADETMQEIPSEELAGSFGGQYLSVASMTFESLNAIVGLGVDLTDAVEQSIIRRGGRRLGLIDLNEQTRQALFDALEQARAEGLGADEIASRLADMISAGPWTTAEIRAMVIARTETKYAQNYSSLLAYQQSDTVTDALIFDAQLGPTDEECEALNGETVSLEEAQALMESEHPNGTRSFAPVVM